MTFDHVEPLSEFPRKYQATGPNLFRSLLDLIIRFLNQNSLGCKSCFEIIFGIILIILNE